MASDNENEVRINVKVDREQNDLLNRMLPWGAKSDILRNILLQVIHGLETDDDGTFYAALARNNVELRIKDV